MDAARLHAFGAVEHLLPGRGSLFGVAALPLDLRERREPVRLPPQMRAAGGADRLLGVGLRGPQIA